MRQPPTGAVGSTVTLTATLTPADSATNSSSGRHRIHQSPAWFLPGKTAKSRNAAGTATITGKARTFTATSESPLLRLIYLARSAVVAERAFGVFMLIIFFSN